MIKYARFIISFRLLSLALSGNKQAPNHNLPQIIKENQSIPRRKNKKTTTIKTTEDNQQNDGVKAKKREIT